MKQAKQVERLQRQMEGMSDLFRLVADEIEIRPGTTDQKTPRPMLIEELKCEEYGAARDAYPQQRRQGGAAQEAKEVNKGIIQSQEDHEDLRQPQGVHQPQGVRQAQGDCCLAKSANGDFTQCCIKVSDKEVLLIRNDRRVAEEAYLTSHPLDTIQCLLAPSMRDGTGALLDSLLLVQSPTRSHHIIFESQEDARKWHQTILRHQGYNLEPIRQYVHSKTLATGSFGRIILSRHRNSRCEVAIKVVAKAYV